MSRRHRRDADPFNPPDEAEPLAQLVKDLTGTDAVTTLTTEDLSHSRELVPFALAHPNLPVEVASTFYHTLDGRQMTFHTAAEAAEGYEQYREAVREVLHGFLEMSAEHHGVLLQCTCPSSLVHD